MILRKKMLLALSLLLTVTASAQMPGWSHIKRLDVTENSGVDVVDYQLALTFDSQTLIGNGQMNADGSDIRFTSGCTGGTNFNYWIESGINTPVTKVWVKIDTILSGATKTIFMHYGNVSASALSSVNGTFVGPHSATDSVSGTNTGGVSDSQRGFRFQPTEDILMTNIGKNEPTGSTRTITLFDFNTQAILYQGQTSGPAAQYSYSSMTNPIWLTTGTQYLCEIYQGASDGYYFGAAPQMGQHLTYLDMRYCNSCTANTFPTNSLGGMHYGYVDFWYYTKKNVSPAPTYVINDLQITGSLIQAVAACPGDSISLNLTMTDGIAPFTYSWNGEGVASPSSEDITALPVSATTIYTVEVTDACAQVLNDTVAFQANPLPNVTITSLDSLICNGDTVLLNASGADTYIWDDMSVNNTLLVAPSVTTTYGVTGTDSNGCVNTATYQVNVNVPLTGTQTIALCYGETFTYNQHVYSQAGTYTDTIAGITACDSIVTTNLTIAPPVDVTVQLSGITLTAAAGATAYQWINCADNAPVVGATSATFEPVANGDYAVIVTEGACSDTSACQSITTIGIDELTGESAYIQVSPNPNNGKFTVVAAFDATATVHDGAGKVIATVELKAGQAQEVVLPQVQRGIYFLSAGNKTTKLSITK